MFDDSAQFLNIKFKNKDMFCPYSSAVKNFDRCTNGDYNL